MASSVVPKKSFGQNFLTDKRVVLSIAEACVRSDEVGRAVVVEIGAGTGNLTRMIAPRAGQLFAIERDRDLVPALKKEFEGTNVTLVEGDAKTAPFEEYFANAGSNALSAEAGSGEAGSGETGSNKRAEGAPRILAGNLPYQITGMLLERAVHLAPNLDRCIFMVQREVADRIVAGPGTKTYGALSVFVQAAFAAKRLFLVPPGAFFPPPKVTSAVISLEPLRPPRAEETAAFRNVVRAAFEQRRKTLRNAWSRFGKEALLRIEAEGIKLEARGETLSVEDFARAASVVHAAAVQA